MPVELPLLRPVAFESGNTAVQAGISARGSGSAAPVIARSSAAAANSRVVDRAAAPSAGAAGVPSETRPAQGKSGSAANPDELAETVFRLIMERFTVESERRGWHPWT
jgi:hypothetical protein